MGLATAFVGLDIQLSKRKARGPYFSTYIHYILLCFRNTMLLRKQERKEGNERALSQYVPVLYVDLKSKKGTNVFFISSGITALETILVYTYGFYCPEFQFYSTVLLHEYVAMYLYKYLHYIYTKVFETVSSAEFDGL